MKAVRYHSYGDSDVLVYEHADRPVAGAGQVVVRVAGTAFNPVDVAIRAGFLQQVFPVAFPHVPNFDVAGVIAEVGEGVSGWSAGDAVVAFLPMTAPGAAAEYVAAPADALAAAPRTVELADAAALPSAGLTAWQALFEQAEVKAGQSVLVNGAGGAVGGYAVQLAKQAGAIVTATASARSAGRIRSYRADRIVDYTATPLPQAVAGQQFDVVLNLVRTSPEETEAGGPGRRRRSLRQHHHPRPAGRRAPRADGADVRAQRRRPARRAGRPRRRRRSADRGGRAAAPDRPGRRPRPGRRRAAGRQDRPDPLRRGLAPEPAGGGQDHGRCDYGAQQQEVRGPVPAS